MNDARQLSPAERAVRFNQATRQYIKALPSVTFSENNTLSFELPKTRFLSKIYLMVKGTFKATHASKTTFTKSTFDMFNILKSIRMEANNGFNPYQISGPMLHLKNLAERYAAAAADNYSLEVLDNAVSSTGVSNDIAFMLELPVTVNERDTVGLILLQNSTTVVNVNIDTAALTSMMTDTDITISDINIKITPVIETFSVPAIPEAVPDYSIVKLTRQQSYQIAGDGENLIKLETGLTYRKLMIYVESDAKYTAITADKVKNFQLLFNGADIPYDIPAEFVAYDNKKAYAGQLPVGCYILDFSKQGLPNLGNGRDYIDTEKLTMFELKINFSGLSGTTNNVIVVAEQLAKMN